MRLLHAAAGAALLVVAACDNEVTVIPGTGGDDATSSTGKQPGVTSSKAASTSGAGAGIGEPSNVYPAPHPDPPEVVSLGGAIIPNPTIVPIFFAGDDPTIKAGVTEFVQQLSGSNYWSAIATEYGVGTTTALPTVTLNEGPPSLISDDEIQAWLAAKLNANDPALPPPSANMIYTIYYPESTTITLPNGDGSSSTSCQEFGGYHLSTKLNAAHNFMSVAYAVLPRCGFFGSGTDDVSAPSSHEFIEAATDAHPWDDPAFGQTDDDHIFYELALGAEVGDLCAQEQSSYTYFPEINYMVQRSWSNAAAKAGHDPCVPAPAGVPYFAAAPVMNDTLSLGQGFNFKGVKIEEGQSRTIEVKLFSDAPTAPFFVDAYDPGTFGGSLSFSFDESQGQNGQTLHLTITVNSAGPYDLEMFYLTASNGNEQHTWYGAVGQ